MDINSEFDGIGFFYGTEEKFPYYTDEEEIEVNF